MGFDIIAGAIIGVVLAIWLVLRLRSRRGAP
jgi:hypothetical protein